MIEKEILSFISSDLFTKYLALFTDKLGKPKVKKRLALQITDYARTDLDTRIRITNGHAEIMQKKGDWAGESFEEISTSLQNNAEVIATTYAILRNFLNSEKVESVVIQMENYIFDTPEYELKLTHQKGKKNVYSFEIEVKDLKDNPLLIAQELDLEINIPDSTPEFWKNYNKEINLPINDMSHEQLVALIQQYLD